MQCVREMLDRDDRGANAATRLLSNVVPAYPIGGKRTLRDNGVWIDALKRDNVELVTTSIEEITPDGVVTSDGDEARGRCASSTAPASMPATSYAR